MDAQWDEALSDEGRLRVRESFGLDAGRLIEVTCIVGVWEHTVGGRMTSPTLAVCSQAHGKRNMPAHRIHFKQSTTKVLLCGRSSYLLVRNTLSRRHSHKAGEQQTWREDENSIGFLSGDKLEDDRIFTIEQKITAARFEARRHET
jgi:hypothetical protein